MIPRLEYAQLAGQFNPQEFNADEIVALAKSAGMKYLVITSKHHDGFSLNDSEVSEYDVSDATPFRRDIIKELHSMQKRRSGLRNLLFPEHPLDDGSNASLRRVLRKIPI